MRLVALFALLFAIGCSNTPPTDIAFVDELINDRKFDEAQKVLLDIPSSQRKTAQWYYLKGRLLFKNEDYVRSNYHFERATQLEPGNPRYYLWLARSAGKAAPVAFVTKRATLSKQTKIAYRKVLELDSSNVAAYRGLIYFHLNAPPIMGADMVEARTMAEKLVKVAPAEGLIEKANIAYHQKNRRYATEILEEGIQRFPENHEFYFQLALILMDSQEFQEAFINLDKALSLNPNDWEVKYQIGRLSALSGLFLEQGERMLESLAENIPLQMDSAYQSMLYTRLAQIHRHQSRVYEMEQVLKAALLLDPQNLRAQKMLQQL